MAYDYGTPQPPGESGQKICRNCSTVNDSGYSYCKLCGAELPRDIPPAGGTPYGTPQNSYNPPTGQPYGQNPYGNAAQPSYGQNSSPSYGQNPYGASPSPYGQNPYGAAGASHAAYLPPETPIDGVPAGQVAAFVGKKAPYYLPKFLTMESTGSKVSFNGAVLALGLLLGFVGISFWFLYRKMYKIGLPLAAAGLILFGGISAYTYQTIVPFLETSVQNAADLQNGVITEDEYARQNMEGILGGSYPVLMVVSTLDSILKIAGTILLALFSNSIYKKFAARRIREVSAAQPGGGTDAVRRAGGTSGGLMGIAIALYCVVYCSYIGIVFYRVFEIMMRTLPLS